MRLTYKLLRFVNSNLFDLKNKITSLKQAMIFWVRTALLNKSKINQLQLQWPHLI
jgi:c-di-GMP-related signal transduction protein